MPRYCTFVDAIELQPIAGTVMRFHATTDREVQCFTMERSTAAKVAYDILAAIERADLDETEGDVVKFMARR